jgi:hypothetical protein
VRKDTKDLTSHIFLKALLAVDQERGFLQMGCRA